MYIYICIYMNRYVNIYTHRYIYVTHTHIYIYICVCVCVFFILVCICIHTACMHIYIYTHYDADTYISGRERVGCRATVPTKTCASPTPGPLRRIHRPWPIPSDRRSMLPSTTSTLPPTLGVAVFLLYLSQPAAGSLCLCLAEVSPERSHIHEGFPGRYIPIEGA